MIEKERLEELIEQGAIIYGLYFMGVIPINIRKGDYVEQNGTLHTQEKAGCYNYFYNEQLFETIEEAEWHREFGCIERTERLVLPTWEEIQKYERFDFKDKYNHSYTLHYISGFKTLAISGWSTEYYAPATKENYTIACRKAKELFLGGSNDTN